MVDAPFAHDIQSLFTEQKADATKRSRSIQRLGGRGGSAKESGAGSAASAASNNDSVVIDNDLVHMDDLDDIDGDEGTEDDGLGMNWPP